MPPAEIEVIAVSINLGTTLDLEALSMALNKPLSKLGDTEVLTFGFKEQNVISFLMFGSGKIICKGALSEKEVEQSVDSLVEILKYVGVKITEAPSVSIESIIANGKLDDDIDLKIISRILENSKLIHSLEELDEVFSYMKIEYQSEQTPWLVHSIPDPKVAIFLFGSGKFVILGAKSEQMVSEAAMKFKERISRLKVK